MNDPLLRETAIVSDVRDDAVELTFTHSAACAGCGICGAPKGTPPMLLVACSDPPPLGSRVTVVFPYRSTWRPAIFIFVLPLILIFVLPWSIYALARLAGASLAPAAALALLAAAAGTALSTSLIRAQEARFRRLIFHQTRIEPLDD